MVDVMRLDIVQTRNHNIVSGVIKRGENAAYQNEEGNGEYVAWDDINRQQMQIFTH